MRVFKKPRKYEISKKIKQVFRKLTLWGSVFAVAAAGIAFYGNNLPASAASCQPAADYGRVDGSVNLPSAATYRIWTRMMVPDAANSNYMFEAGGNCYVIGGSNLQANTWVWVSHQNGDVNSKVQLSLAAGPFAFKLIGNKPGVKIDRLVFASDLNCVPAGDGANCNTPSDTAAPVVDITNPQEDAKLSGTIPVNATVTDDTGVTKVDFYINSKLTATDTSSPYSFDWDTTTTQNGTYQLVAKAYDAAGNVSSDSFAVIVENGDSQAPSAPGNLSAKLNSQNKVDLTWQASTDNIAVTGYVVLRDTVPVAILGNVTNYTDNQVLMNTSYSYRVQAYDAVGNKSAPSSQVTVKTPNPPDTSPPTTPSGLSATAASPTQINLIWQASSDNLGVAGYEVYRILGDTEPQKIATVKTTSYGDTGLQANTPYSYYLIAKDAAGNISQPTEIIKATTLQAPPANQFATVTGKITNQSGQPLGRAYVYVPKGNAEGRGHEHVFQANSKGEYKIRRLNAGQHNFSYRAPGYRNSTYGTTLSQGQVLVKDVTLRKR